MDHLLIFLEKQEKIGEGIVKAIYVPGQYALAGIRSDGRLMFDIPNHRSGNYPHIKNPVAYRIEIDTNNNYSVRITREYRCQRVKIMRDYFDYTGAIKAKNVYVCDNILNALRSAAAKIGLGSPTLSQLVE